MRDDGLTIGAVAVIAMCVATVAHEAIGHGGACLLLGGRITLLTSVYFRCAAQSILISPAGPVGNLLAGLVAWATLRLLPPTKPRAKLFAFLLAAFSFYWALGYLVSSLATGEGDYAIAFRDFLGNQTQPWHYGEIVAGGVLYLIFSRTLAASATRSFGARITQILSTAWFAAALSAVAAAALYTPDRKGAMLQAGLEIGAASIPLLIPHRQAEGAGAIPLITRNKTWVFAAAILFAAFAVTLGTGYAA